MRWKNITRESFAPIPQNWEEVGPQLSSSAHLITGMAASNNASAKVGKNPHLQRPTARITNSSCSAAPRHEKARSPQHWPNNTSLVLFNEMDHKMYVFSECYDQNLSDLEFWCQKICQGEIFLNLSATGFWQYGQELGYLDFWCDRI